MEEVSCSLFSYSLEPSTLIWSPALWSHTSYIFAIQRVVWKDWLGLLPWQPLSYTATSRCIGALSVDEAIIIPSGLTVMGNLSFWLASPQRHRSRGGGSQVPALMQTQLTYFRSCMGYTTLQWVHEPKYSLCSLDVRCPGPLCLADVGCKCGGTCVWKE